MNNNSTLSQNPEVDQQEFTTKFNVFKILGKDDKELIHSAFIQFLLENDYGFCEHFEIDALPIKKVRLEKAYTLTKKKEGKTIRLRRRIDIEGLGENKKPVLVIENKFKSFPYEQQLKDYEKIYEQHYSGENPVKILFCFDKNLIHFKNSWKVLDYRDLSIYVELVLKEEEDPEKQIFLRHYLKFLSDYYKKYDEYRQDFRNLLEHPTVADNKFWLRLMYSAVRIKLEKEFYKPNFRFLVNPGNTNVPLINIIPAHWTFGDFEFLIQFQGKELKFYVHILNTKQGRSEAEKEEQKIFLEKVIQLTRKKIVNSENYSGEGKLKNLGKMNYRSYYLYKEDITSFTSTTYITVEYLKDRVHKFYNKINEEIIAQLTKN